MSSFSVFNFSNLIKSIPLSLYDQTTRHLHDDDGEFSGRVSGNGVGSTKKPCRACTDFQSWLQQRKISNKPPVSNKNESQLKERHQECPLDKDELGRRTWSFLHTMAAYYPENPTPNDETIMKQFINGLARFYPCESCAKDFQDDLAKDPPETKNQKTLSKWWCRQHNRVNKKLRKPEFDCEKVDQRWLDGWEDGSCE